MIEGGATHLGVATDHVVEYGFGISFIRDTKPARECEPELMSQFPILEEALESDGSAGVGDGGV